MKRRTGDREKKEVLKLRSWEDWKLGSWEKIEDRKLGKLEVMKIRSWEDGKRRHGEKRWRIMSNDKLQMSNQCQITNAKILLIWSDTACLYRKELRCGVNRISQPTNETEFIFRYLGI
ncbi:hypothetical protein GQ543_09265 [candidate division WOR-3 bacterium]|nr:hypothetical protein [candidate division WOR-3 bacterium]